MWRHNFVKFPLIAIASPVFYQGFYTSENCNSKLHIISIHNRKKETSGSVSRMPVSRLNFWFQGNFHCHGHSVPLPGGGSYQILGGYVRPRFSKKGSPELIFFGLKLGSREQKFVFQSFSAA